MENRFLEFHQLHHQNDPLLIGNVWNVQSARIFEKSGLNALATSSASVAETLGYEDGEAMSFEDYVFVIQHLAKSTALPLSVDLETGYGGTAEEITQNIRTLCNLGVCGINLEDSVISGGNRTIADAAIFADKIRQIKKLLDKDGLRIFINIRCDVFLLGLSEALEEGIRRVKLYNATGAQGLFMPCITEISDIQKVCEASTLPVNVMCMPTLPDFCELQKAGVKRISMGPFVSKNLYQKLDLSVQKIVKDGSFKSLF